MKFVRKWVMFPIYVLKILRAMFIIWLLEKLTYPENIQLICFGRFVVNEGDIAALNANGKYEYCKVTGQLMQDDHSIVNMRIFRRPSGK